MAYPATLRGESPDILEVLHKTASDDYFDAIEVNRIQDDALRKQAAALLQSARLKICYGAQPRLKSKETACFCDNTTLQSSTQEIYKEEKKMKIVILDAYTANPGDLSWDSLAKLGELTVYDRTPVEEIVSRIGDAQAVFTNKAPLSAQTLAACPNLKFVGVLATGFNIVDVEAAKAQGIVVCNVPGYSTAAVAQFVFALLLEICHHVGAHSNSVHKGRWASCVDFAYWNYPLTELAGKTFGIIGFGRIGQSTAQIAAAMGMKVLACTPRRSSVAETDSIRYATLEEVLAQSDVLSLHCPLTADTQGIINKESIAKMKDGAILINTSRGPLLVEEDVAQALNSGKLFAAGVDVVSGEPINPANPLLGAQNCIITPHIAWAPTEARIRLLDITTKNLAAFLKGSPINVVSK